MIQDKRTEKRIVFIDKQNLDGVQKELGKKINYSEFFKFKFLAKNKETEVFFYFPCKPPKVESEEKSFYAYTVGFLLNTLRPELNYSGISFQIFPVNIDRDRERVDEEIKNGIIDTLLFREVDEIVIVSGDGDFFDVLKKAKMKGIKISVVAGEESCSMSFEAIAEKIYYIGSLLQEHPEFIYEEQRTQEELRDRKEAFIQT